MPTSDEDAETVMIANAKMIGSIDEAIAAEIATSHAPEHGPCATCARDYSSLCPRLWGEVSAGMCVAPDSYGGPCQAAAYFSAMSIADKKSHEKRCSVCWPCVP